MKIENEQGYLVIAQNTDTVDYIKCARVLAQSIRQVEPDAKICLLTDIAIEDECFDYVKTFPFGDQSGDSEWKLHNDWQAFYATPFRQTIKIEADMVVPVSIKHWFQACQHRDLVVTIGARNYHNQRSTCRTYRKVFDDNDLPDAYNAITYWRLSRTAELFFRKVKEIFDNWDTVMSLLKFAAGQPLNTDLAYAIAIRILGEENCTLPGDVPGLIHMKPGINDLQGPDWTKELIWEIEPGSLRINTVNQLWPFHYHEKSWVEKVEKHYG